jgi:hypothetical protein
MQLTIVTIGVFVAALNEATKYIAKNILEKDINKWIPILSVVYGIILGIIGYFIPNGNMGSDILEAIFIGASAGGSAVAGHQTYKHLTKDKTGAADATTPEPEPETEQTEAQPDEEKDTTADE